MTNKSDDKENKTKMDVLEKYIDKATTDLVDEKSKIRSFANNIVTYPAKVIASFITAPFLIFKIVLTVKDIKRRLIAVTGFAIALFCTYVATSFLGSIGGAIFIASTIGIFTGAGFFIGSQFSGIVSFIFAIVVFNSISYIFLKISSKEVAEYLEKVST